MHHMFAINHVALLAAAAIQWIIGVLWFGFFFKKSWKGLVGGEATTGGRAIFILVCSFVANLVLCFVLANIVAWASTPTYVGGVALAILCWLAFIAPPMFAQHIHERRPVNQYAINATYWLVAMAVSGGVLAVWR